MKGNDAGIRARTQAADAKTLGGLFSRESVSWMSLVVSDEHDTQLFGAGLVEDVIREALQVRATEALVGRWKLQRTLRRFVDNGAKLVVELVREALGNLVVLGENFRHVPLDQRVIDYFHAARCRLMAFQKSSELIAFAAPESRS